MSTESESIQAEEFRRAARDLGAEHYREAQRLVSRFNPGPDELDVAKAQVHAQLAALAFGNPYGVGRALGLTGQEKPA